MYCQHREKEGKDRLQETEKTMEEKTEQETVQETTCSGHEHEHDKPRYGRQNKSKSIYITKIAIVVFTLILLAALGCMHLLHSYQEKEEKLIRKAEFDYGKAMGLADGVISLLEEKGRLSEDQINSIRRETRPEKQTEWFKLAIKVDTIDEFFKKANIKRQ